MDLVLSSDFGMDVNSVRHYQKGMDIGYQQVDMVTYANFQHGFNETWLM